jgi:hypothetical protein
MKRRIGKTMAVLAVLLILRGAAHPARAQAGPLADSNADAGKHAATLVVYNSSDPSSAALAAFYAKRRGIPPEHIVGLGCPASDEISRAQYDETIAEPLRRIFC